ncbi:DNA polymerase [Candidatus Nitrosotenuis sp. DW1]|uniref:DNA polymerase n=1 Tax=Candidatus Nitrosotenuis sp. DW1 TaxID=2259672 RepID=UPI0015C7C972|nr:DNA polymerase [Candidatus Nitrosotenuis sp. DW1]QLH08813.1 DNA polymerase [Candidatus Nitrosotenuis sp. DW1]
MVQPKPITDFKGLSRYLSKIPQNRDCARSDLRPIYALDTETREGNIFLIADSDGNWLDGISAESVIKFLFSKRYQGTWNFFYNLGYDAEVILKLLGSELNRYKKTNNLSFSFGKYKISYIPDRCLKITHGHKSTIFYDIAQFYHASLTDAYQNNIGKLDPEYLSMKEKRKQFSKWFYHNNRNKVREYCIQDCKFTKELAEHWVKLFHDAFSFYPSRWISSGYLAEKVLINNGIYIPKFAEIPFEVNQLAMRSYFGGRFEILKRGFIGTAHLYDINSAYPYAITKIPDLTMGKWVQRKSIHPNAKLGFFRILANIPDDKYVPPFPFRVNGIVIFPSGQFETYCTLAELQACDNPKFYKIIDSWQFVPSSDVYPYADFIKKLYQKRLELKKDNDPMQMPIKIILNSIYGKTGQKIKGRIGNLFNPVIFSFITGFARAQLYRFVMENNIEKEIVAFATDSICTTKKLDFDSDKLGEFSHDASADDVFYLQNGFYRFNGKWKQRGLGKLKGKEIEHLDTFEKNGRLYYKFIVMRNNRLRSSIIQDDIKEIGKIKPNVREVNLNADRKRFWLNIIESIDSKTISESSSLSLNHFTKDEI